MPEAASAVVGALQVVAGSTIGQSAVEPAITVTVPVGVLPPAGGVTVEVKMIDCSLP